MLTELQLQHYRTFGVTVQIPLSVEGLPVL